MRRNGLGGVIIMGDNVPSNPTDESAGLPAVTKAVQAAVKESGRSWPAVIGIDQEGGPVTRITSGVTPLPGAMAYGAADDAALATQLDGLLEDYRAEFVVFNGQPGMILYFDGRLQTAITLRVVDDLIVDIYVMRNPDKLARLQAVRIR